MELQVFTFNGFEENTYVVSCGSEAYIIDPGCYDAAEKNELRHYIDQRQLKVQAVLNTHCHIDHVLGNDFAATTWKAPLLIPEREEAVLRAVAAYAGNYGFAQYTEKLPDGVLQPGQALTVGAETLSVLFVPGHSPGHVAFYSAARRFVLGGDVLFRQSIGRTDLPGGHFETLIQSIHRQLFTLPDDVVVYPGHGPATTIGAEKKSNPFCAIASA
jgi:glyoxylase-like metal-dependent hydrolase (beta-lactamase superfamily II)